MYKAWPLRIRISRLHGCCWACFSTYIHIYIYILLHTATEKYTHTDHYMMLVYTYTTHPSIFGSFFFLATCTYHSIWVLAHRPPARSKGGDLLFEGLEGSEVGVAAGVAAVRAGEEPPPLCLLELPLPQKHAARARRKDAVGGRLGGPL